MSVRAVKPVFSAYSNHRSYDDRMHLMSYRQMVQRYLRRCEADMLLHKCCT